MTRQEAITIFKNNCKARYGITYSNLINTALGDKEWGKAASILLDHYNYTNNKMSLALADALWEGKK